MNFPEGIPELGRMGRLDKAVEMCNNSGHCRSSTPGDDPSYRATRQIPPRGRANTLALSKICFRHAKEALDLCVSCKGCKRECPTASTWRA
jgi:Fe-S oxidoreductase